MSQEWSEQVYESSKQIIGFGRAHRDAEHRIKQLESLREKAGVSGGRLTLNIEALQDGLLDIHVAPDVLLPYIDSELESQRALLKKYELKTRHILEIINS